ncbi:MAG TPA: class I SAM-dependent methyltransferase, partial [Nocardioides sp.]|nr:class I SAM-dependent methyltransferase [Nocardioides sp.]
MDERYRSVRDAYDAVAADYAALISDTSVESALELAMVDDFVTVVGDGEVLDAGCGAGRMSRYLADRGVRVRGVDLSPGMVAMARRDHPDIDFGVGSLSALPYADATFDGVLLWYSTIHTDRSGQARLYDEAARVLRPGGHLLVGFQAGEGSHDTSAAYARYGHDVTLLRYRFTADEVTRWLSAAGLREAARMVRRPRGAEK